MNRQNRINNLIQLRNIAEEAEKQYQEALTQQVTVKLNRMAGVILSVASKMNVLRDKNILDRNVALGDLLWARRNLEVTSLNETGFTVIPHALHGSRPDRDRLEERTFPWEMLSMSDRDVAKLTRATIREHQPEILERQLKTARRQAEVQDNLNGFYQRMMVQAENSLARSIERKEAQQKAGAAL